MQSSPTQPSKTERDFYRSLQSIQIPGAYGDPLPIPPPAHRPPGSAHKNSVAPAPEGIAVYPQKLPWTTRSLATPRDHFTFAVFAAICCLPLGLVAVYRSAQCKDAIKRGDIQLARERSHQAKTLSYWSLGFGVLCLVAVIIGFGVYIATVYRHDMRVWMSERDPPLVRLDKTQDDRPPPTGCCMQV